MTKPKPPGAPRLKPGRKPLPLEQRKLWTLPDIREHCRITLTDCWEWKFVGQVSDHQRRYKCLVHGGQRHSARQVAYLLVFGKLPAADLNLSPAKCLNPHCISPFHCRPVTESEKCLIGSRRGTFATPERARNIARGKQAHNSKLPGGMEAARQIRRTAGAAREHAPMYGISVSMFNAIRRGVAWKEAA